MATTTQRRADGIVYKPPVDIEVPKLDLLTFLFDSEFPKAQDDTIVHASAADPSQHLTKAQLRQLSKRIAATLRTGYGIGANGSSRDIVLSISTGHYQLPAIFCGIIAAGGIFSSASPASTPAELAGHLRDCGAKLLITHAHTKEVAVKAAELAGLTLDRVLVHGETTEFSLIEASSGKTVPLPSKPLEWARVTDRDELDNSIICLLFSSGTTGKPKAVRLSHTNVVAESHILLLQSRKWFAEHRPGWQSRTLAHLPVAHIAGVQGYLVNPVYNGATVYWMPRFDFEQFLTYVKKYKITDFFSVPPIYLLLAKHPAVTDQLDSFDNGYSGAAPMGKDLQRAARAKLGKGQARLAQTWGMSETTGSITYLPRTLNDDTGSVGALIPSHEAKIVDEDDKDVEPGTPGEIWVRGPVVTKGYFNNPAANEETFKNGWLRTGDIGLFQNGLLYIVDRKKELIKYKGLQVAPAELEALLVSHPHILDAAVIGVEGQGTEVPRAYVVADPKKTSAADIMQWVEGQVASHKKLRGGVVFVDAIPKSPSGKILRKVLRERAKKESAAKL